MAPHPSQNSIVFPMAGTKLTLMTSHNALNTLNTSESVSESSARLLGAADIRTIAAEEGITPTKKFGQNFVIDPGTVRKIVRAAGIQSTDKVLEVGPGLGSLTLGLLETGAHVTAVESDPPLAQRLPITVKQYQPEAAGRFNVINQDALKVTPEEVGFSADEAFSVVANLPYNVATPIILTLLEKFHNIETLLVMVQKEVAERLCAAPGNKIYGVTSVKLAWYGTANLAGVVGRNVFWPAPHVDSALTEFHRYSSDDPRSERAADSQLREETFALIDQAFGQRRKTLHAALKKVLPEEAYEVAHIDSTRRGETLTIDDFASLALAQRTIQTLHL